MRATAHRQGQASDIVDACGSNAPRSSPADAGSWPARRRPGANCDRTIRIVASDYATEVLVAPALAALSGEAPNLRFQVINPQDDLIETLERGTVDIVLSLDCVLSSEHPMRQFFEDEFVVVGWAHNSLLDQEMTAERFFEFGHVSVEFGRSHMCSFEENYFRKKGLQRQVEIVSPSFAAIPSLLAGSNRIAMMQRRLAVRAARRTPLRIIPSPFDMPPLRQAAQWYKSSHNDPALRWIIDKFAEVARRNDQDVATDNVVPMTRTRDAGLGLRRSSERSVTARR